MPKSRLPPRSPDSVIARLDPAIHLLPKMFSSGLMDARIESGDDECLSRTHHLRILNSSAVQPQLRDLAAQARIRVHRIPHPAPRL
jgi:hypothetical protein